MDKKYSLCNVISTSYAQEHLPSNTVLEVLGYPVKFLKSATEKKRPMLWWNWRDDIFNVPAFSEGSDFGVSLNKVFTLLKLILRM